MITINLINNNINNKVMDTYPIPSKFTAFKIISPGSNIAKSTKWINIKGKYFEESKNNWYNLHTSRFVTSMPTTYSPVYGLKGVKVLGTLEEIEQFITLNSNIQDNKNSIFKPFENIEFLSNDASERSQICFINTINIINERDVSSLTNDHINSICKFTFAGLFVKGKICNVIDGDTFDVICFIPIESLSRSRAIADDNIRTPAIPIDGYHKGGFFTKITIRMYGYDSEEKNFEAGQLAKRLMEEKFNSINNIVWCQFITTADDKYGRTLSVLYEDEQKTKLLNDYLLKQEEIHNTKMVYPYVGGTKKSF